MKNKLKKIGSIGIPLTILFSIVLLTFAAEVGAKAKIVAIEGISYNVNFSLAHNLKSLIGKKVSVTLNSGNTFTGVVKDVGNHLIHLEKLAGKDFFDALIRIENISAIDARFRNYQR
jgi:hypothetical protein